jgi:predicted oxidoreductase
LSTRRDFLTQALPVGLLATAPVELPQPGNSDTESQSTTALKSYRIPHTDLVVSRIAFGCAVLGVDWTSADFVAIAAKLIRTAYEQGITFFDLADIYGYGKAEAALGKVLKETAGLRQRIVIQSKCGALEGAADNSRTHILSAVHGSLERLGVEHLDILLLHFPDSLVEPEEVAEAFDKLKRSGKVRFFGVSNHGSVQIQLLQRYVREPLVTNQIQLGLAHWVVLPDGGHRGLTHGDEGVTTLDYCRLHDIQVQAYSPLKGDDIGQRPSLLTPCANATPEFRHATQLLNDIASAHGVTPAAVMLAWLLRHPSRVIPIIGGTNTEHLIQNCAADGVQLSREEWYSLFNAAAAIYSPRIA